MKRLTEFQLFLGWDVKQYWTEMHQYKTIIMMNYDELTLCFTCSIVRRVEIIPQLPGSRNTLFHECDKKKKTFLPHSLTSWKFTIFLHYWYLSCFQGGIPFYLMLKEALLESDTTGVANFDGIGDVPLAKTNPHTFSGLVPGKLIVHQWIVC